MSEAVVKKSSYKKLFSNTVIFAVGSFSSKVLILLLVKVYTTYLSREELGINDVITQIANWLQPIVTMTISEAVIRFGLDKAFDKKKVFTLGNIVCLCGFAMLGIILPIVTVTGIADKYLNGYSLLLYVYVVMSGLKLVYSTFVRALEKVKLFAVNGILTTLLTLVGTVMFMIGFRMGNTGYLLSIIVSDGLSVVFLTFSARLWRYLDFHKPDREVLSVMLRYSLPLIPAQILWLVINSSDSFMTTSYLGPAANGVMSASYKIPNLVATVYFMFGQAWNMSAIMEDDSDDRNEFYSNVFELNQCLLYIVSAGCLMIVRPLTKIWFGPEFQDSAFYSPLLIFSSVFSCFVTFLGSIYLTSRKTLRSLATSLVAGVTNIGLNILLLPRIGLYGPAISTLASYSLVFIIRAYDSRKIVPFDLKIHKIVTNIALLGLMVVFNVDDVLRGIRLSWLLQPLLFLVVFLLNYNTLWKTVSRMLPKKVSSIIERLGIYRCIALAIFAAALTALSTVTGGWLFFIISGAIVAAALTVKNRFLAYSGVALMFAASAVERGMGSASIVTAALMLLIFAVFRRPAHIPVIVILGDLCLGAYYGMWAAVFAVCVEILILIGIFAKPIFKSMKILIFTEDKTHDRA